jgi:hypothetical protein
MKEYIPTFIGHGKICGLSFMSCKTTDSPLQYSFYVEGEVAVVGSESLMRSLMAKICYLHDSCGSVKELLKALVKISHYNGGCHEKESSKDGASCST